MTLDCIKLGATGTVSIKTTRQSGQSDPILQYEVVSPFRIVQVLSSQFVMYWNDEKRRVWANKPKNKRDGSETVSIKENGKGFTRTYYENGRGYNYVTVTDYIFN